MHGIFAMDDAALMKARASAYTRGAVATFERVVAEQLRRTQARAKAA
jgi:hypothetical protein